MKFACARTAISRLAAGFHFCRMLVGLVLVLPVLVSGCGTYVAHQMVQAPNTFPSWLAPSPPVLVAFNGDLLTNSPSKFVGVGPPAARLHYRVVEPADYHLQVMATNWMKHGQTRYQFTFRAEAPRSNAWSAAPRGTVFLLHGYGLAEFAMVPWAWRLAGDGWRCVLVDLRGHGQSTGKTIYYGLTEARDLSQLLDALAAQDQLAPPVAVVGESYGAALALRWKSVDPRVGRVVAIAPYGVLSNAVLNGRRVYASLMPRMLIRAGLEQLPVVLGVQAEDLDTTTVLARHPVSALFITGSKDDLIPPAEVRAQLALASPGSALIEVSGARHETVTYYFDELVPPVLAWLDANGPTVQR